MQITVALDEQGFLPDAYAKYCADEDKTMWSCRRSFPFVLSDMPKETKALAIVFMDWDSTPVCGFPWMHWVAYMNASECEALRTAVAEGGEFTVDDDASRTAPAWLHQGYNSAAKSEPERGEGYVGPCPPDKDHVYTIRVMALGRKIELPSSGFWANELVAACKGAVLTQAGMDLPSRC